MNTYKEVLVNAYKAIEKLKLELKNSKVENDIAIVGMACRFPGKANSLKDYWSNLLNGIDGVDIQSRKWEGEYESLKSRTYKVGEIEGVDKFEASFFGISPREAKYIDPQHRILLEIAWECFEDAGLVISGKESNDIGVFIGITANDYLNRFIRETDIESVSSFIGVGNAHNSAAGRISHTYGLQGPSLTIDTACSSSLSSIHLACRALAGRECNTALAGGVNLITDPFNTYLTDASKMISPDGRCKSFDSTADGYVRSEGCGLILLKRLEDAIREKDQIYAIIKGTGINHNGHSSAISVPNVNAQANLIATVLRNANLEPGDIDYIEAHGTGTQLGDPIEIDALNKIFRSTHTLMNPLIVGSVKSNIGHLESASGVAGVIKSVLILKNRIVPANLHLKTISEHIDTSIVPIKIANENIRLYKKDAINIGVSSFGISGINSHVIIQEYNNGCIKGNGVDGEMFILTFSARSLPSLKKMRLEYLKLFDLYPEISLRDLCISSNNLRFHFNYRKAYLANCIDHLKKQLCEDLCLCEQKNVNMQNKCAFIFTGQGSQYPQMTKELYDGMNLYRKHIDICDEILVSNHFISLKSLLFDNESYNKLEDVVDVQISIFCVEYSLAKTLEDIGIEPYILLGHSLGEYVAACIAGIFSLEDAINLVVNRAMLTKKVVEGEMYYLNTTEEKVYELLEIYPDLSIAAVNGPFNIVISGLKKSFEGLLPYLDERNIRYKRLLVDRAFHSVLMQNIFCEYEKVLSLVKFNKPRKKIVSNITGYFVEDEMCKVQYWLNHLQAPVMFQKSIQCLLKTAITHCIEIGSKPDLIAIIKSFVRDSPVKWLSCIRKGNSDLKDFYSTLKCLYVDGFDINWNDLNESIDYNRIPLPTYPFNKELAWVDNKIPYNRVNGINSIGGFKTPHINVIEFEILLDESTFWDGHIINNKKIFPASAYVEMMNRILSDVFSASDIKLENLVFLNPVLISIETSLNFKVIISESYVELVYKALDEHFTCAKCEFSLNSRNEYNIIGSFDFAEDDCIVSEEFYSYLNSKGYQYSGNFRGVQRINKKGTYAISEIGIESFDYEDNNCFIQPALLDSCTHTIAMFISESNNDIFIPVSIGQVEYKSHLKNHCFCKTEIKSENKDCMIFDLYIYNTNKELCLVLNEIVYKKYVNSRFRTLKHLYDVKWQKLDLKTSSFQDVMYIFIGDINDRINEILNRKIANHQYVNVQINCDTGLLDLDVLNMIKLSKFKSVQILYFMGIEYLNSINEYALIEYNRKVIMPLLEIVKWVDNNGGNNVTINIVTGLVPPFATESLFEIYSNGLWGLGNVIRNEYSTLKVRSIGVGDMGKDQVKDSFWGVINSDILVNTVILSNGDLYYPYISSLNIFGLLNSANFTLDISKIGMLDTLYWKNILLDPPEDNQVLIETRSVGVNFKEVLYATGKLNIENLGGKDFKFGFECSGVVRSVGKNVSRFKVDDEVIGVFTWGGMSKYVCVDQKFVFMKPQSISFGEAAALPIAYITAYYSLIHLAKVCEGNKVLIHAAAGGVGQAAIQIASYLKAEIYVTASLPKHDYLKSQGITHILDSRDVRLIENFSDKFEGVQFDVVLNSLAGEVMYKSLQSCKIGGVFIELGKVSEEEIHKIKNIRPDVCYYNFDLVDVANSDVELIRSCFGKVLDLLNAGFLSLLPIKMFDMKDCEDAFRFLALGKNIGKVVVDTDCILNFKKESVYIVVGGTGGIGLEFCKWLISKGAKQIIVLSRRAEENKHLFESMIANDINIITYSVDVANYDSLLKIINRISDLNYQIKGVFNLAGVINDKLISSLNEDDMLDVVRVKMLGTWNLHKATEKFDLDFFVCFSSLSSILGTIGQANYAIANAVMDGIVSYRNNMGKVALVVNWGPFDGVGMASSLDWTNIGINKISLSDTSKFDILLEKQVYKGAQIICGDINWDVFLKRFPSLGDEDFYKKVRKNDILDEGSESDVYNYSSFSDLRDTLMILLKHILGMSEQTECSLESSFFDLGMNSLMAIEYKECIEKKFGICLNTTLLFKYPTLLSLCNYLYNEYFKKCEDSEYSNYSLEKLSDLLDKELNNI